MNAVAAGSGPARAGQARAAARGDVGHPVEAAAERPRQGCGCSARRDARLQAPVVGHEHDPAVLAADVDAAAAQRGRGVQVVAVAQDRVARGGVEGPAAPAGARVERVEAAVGGADVEDAPAAARRSPEDRRGADGVAGVVAPAQVAAQVERVDRAVGGGDVDALLAERGRRVDVVVGGVGPAVAAGLRIERVDGAVERADVDRATGADRRRGGDEADGGPAATSRGRASRRRRC